jgi:hypothetical protein
MGPSDVAAVRERLRRRYELARARRALIVLIPILAMAGLTWRVAGDLWGPIFGGALLSVVGVVFLWRGQAAGRVVVPAMLAGAVPFACALWAHCAGERSVGVCTLACLGASVAAGLMVARVARRSDAHARTWAYAGSVAILTGSIACACLGIGGLLGLALGFGAVAVPSLLAPSRAST